MLFNFKGWGGSMTESISLAVHPSIHPSLFCVLKQLKMIFKKARETFCSVVLFEKISVQKEVCVSAD